MKIYTYLALLLFFLSNCTISDHQEGWIDTDLFLDPTVEYRSAPFYSLNDELDTTEIIKQIKSFKEGGYGGSFLHSRGGLLTEYMGAEWWEAMDAAVRTSKELGIKAWFYDEDKWPSGFAGGKIPLMDEEFHARSLSRVDRNEKLRAPDEVLFEDDNYKYIIHKARMGNSWFNGTCYSDLLNPQMVKAFIDSAYAPYLERYKDEIGKTVPGIFTDEPQISPRVSGGREGSVSFSPIVVDAFKAMHGYDLLPVIPSLFDTIGNYKKIRYDYYQTISKCFEENFTKQIGTYSGGINAVFTGHLNGEENFNSVMVNSGNSMVNYRHMQMPGIDHLGLHYIPLNVPRSVASVANQYGISRRMSESYGISGHNMSFEDRKWLLDYLTINGINFIVPHLSSYSMKGERKRDYPPNFSPTQPYWEYNKIFEDYSARMCYVNTIGKYAAELLIIHPLESEYLGVKNEGYNKYNQLLHQLHSHQRDYDIGDEQIIAEIARIKDRGLEVGQMAYKLVILPYMLVIRQTTLNLLKEFSEAGGKIIVYDRYPEYVDGKLNAEALEVLKDISQLAKEDKIMTVIENTLPAKYTIDGTERELIWAHYREVSNGGILQLSNTSRFKEVDCTLKFADKNEKVALWNPETGHSMKLKVENDGGIKLHFAATQSWIITIGNASREAHMADIYEFPGKKTEVVKIIGTWEGERLDPNALTLDFARYSTDKGKTFSDYEPIIGIHQRLTRDKYNGNLLLKFEAQIDDVPSNCSLVVEQPHLYEIEVNGKPIRFEGTEFYREHTFKIQKLSGALKEGKNEILLSVNYVAPKPSSYNAIERYGTEIESIYLTGDFAVSGTLSEQPLKESQKYRDNTLVKKPVYNFSAFKITKEKSTFDNDLVLEGYPFYAGNFRLSNSFKIGRVEAGKKYIMSFPLFEAIVLKVKVNGHEFAPLLYSPWELDITEALKNGENKIEVELINSLRNLLGPHHHADGELKAVGPASFTGSPLWPNVAGEYDWYDLRLHGNATIWRDDYCMVSLGLLEPPVLYAVE